MKNNYLNEYDPWSGILEAMSFAVRNMYNTKLQGTPDQLVFGRDMTLNTPFISLWESSRRRQQLIENNNNNNKHYKPHILKVCEEVTVRDKKAIKCEDPYKGSHPITKIW